MASCRTRLTDAQWLQHKPSIRRMIIDENISQEETRQRLKDEGVLVTKAQLEYKLKIWGFRKRTPKNSSHIIWQFIGYRVEKRKRQHKASDVFINGQLVDPAKARKEINRHQPTSLGRLKQAGKSPKAPESTEVIICTPASAPMHSLWPTFLPWFQFQRSIPLSLAVLHPSEVINHESIKSVAKTKTNFLYPFAHMIGDSKIDNVSFLTTGLNILMPESCADENLGRARLLMCGSEKEALFEHVNLVFYQISNNLGRLDVNPDQWLSITALLEDSGILKMSFQLGKITDTTLLSVTESLFQKALDRLWEDYRYSYWYEGFVKERVIDLGLQTYEGEYDEEYEEWDGGWFVGWDADMLTKLPSWRIINWLLACGQNPNTPIPLQREEEVIRFTPLQMAADMACPQLIFLLLDANADPTLIFDEPDPFIKTFLRRPRASCNDSVRLLKRLLGDDACVGFFDGQQRASLLAAAVEGVKHNFDNYQAELLDLLIGSEAERCANYRTRSPLRWATRTCSVLGHAAQLPDESVAISCLSHLLRRFSQPEPSRLSAQSITPDVFLLAASRGHNKVLKLLQELKVDLTLCGHRGITALHVAAYHGHLETCQRLLESGVPVDGYADSQHLPSPLHLAVCKSELEIIQLLHGYGAQLIRSITAYERQYWHHENGSFHQEGTVTPVGAAMYQDNRQICEFFAQQRVTFPPSAAHCAVSRSKRRPQDVRLALKLGADPDWTGKDGFSALQIALKRQADESVANVFEIAITLLDAGATLKGGEISKAILLNYWTLINRLLEMDDLGIGQQHELISVLETAIANGNQYLVMKILTHYPGVYDAGALCSSVFFADHDLRLVEYLLNNRPQLQHMLPLESLAIGIAAWKDRADLLGLLLAKLHHPSTATLPTSMLQQAGGDLYICISNAKCMRELFWRNEPQILISPLALAVLSNNSLSRLLEHGFTPDRLTMSIAARIGHGGAIRKLLHYPMVSSSFAADEDYEGPLAVAARSNDIETARSLLDANHCINEDNHFVLSGRSPLQMAVEGGHLDLIKCFLSAGADVNTPAAFCGGATALQLAAIKGYLGVAKMLVDLGADVNAPGAMFDGRTALEGAAEQGRIDTIQYLLSQGAETNAKGRLSYLRAIRYAELEGHVVAARLLKTWREWIPDDDALWNELQFLSRSDCERFGEENFAYESDVEPELHSHSSREIHDGDVMQDLVLDDTTEARTHEISVAENPAGGIIPELGDLETMANDIYEFYNGPRFDLDIDWSFNEDLSSAV